ncbi:hypothetical protein [Streptomyces sp. NPDC047453]|uniref:hypothetical protein n=1 Tax=Streptomyces sp. NPDC047453 TaxID=3154812 RepID=UPI0033E6A68E
MLEQVQDAALVPRYGRYPVVGRAASEEVAADWERDHDTEGARERVPGVRRGVAGLVAVSTMPVRRTMDARDGDPPGTCGTRRARR